MSFPKIKYLSLPIFLTLTFICAKCLYNDAPIPSQLELDQTSLDFQQNDTTITLTLENTGQENLKWNLNTDLNWFKTARPNSGEIKCFHKTPIEIVIDRSKLSKAGQNRGQLTFTARPQSSEIIKSNLQEITLKAFKVAKPSVKMLAEDVNEVKITTARVKATIQKVGSSDITQHGHLRSTQPNPTLASENIFKSELGIRTNEGIFETSFSTLSPNTTYYIRAYATNAEGISYSQTFTFKTGSSPTAMTLSKTSILENNLVNTIIGTFNTTDADASDSHIYSLVSGIGDTDNGSFNISGSSLRASVVFDYEAKASYSIRIRTSDTKGGTFEKAFTITITNLNDAPTAMTLSKTSILENNLVNTIIGTLSTTDADASDSHIYSLVSGIGDTDNGSFNISGSSLRASVVFDYEAKASYSIRIRTSDTKGGTFEKAFTITITNFTDIILSNTSISENNLVNTIIGTLSTTDADASASHIYSLVSGIGDTDNDSFNISGSSLRASVVFDYEAKASYSIRIRTSDTKGGTFEKAFTITISDIYCEPVTYNGKTYKTVLIGTQCWLAENLNDTGHTSGNSYCYNRDNNNCKTYGRLYDWNAAVNIASKIPGWHLPTDNEWQTLEIILGMSPSVVNNRWWRGSPVGTKLRQGNSSGFEVLYGGFRTNGAFYGGLGTHADFWTASSLPSGGAENRTLAAAHGDIARLGGSKSFSFSVRLVKD